MKKFASLLMVLSVVVGWTLGGGAKRAAAQPALGEQVVGGPYVVNVGPRSAAVMWIVKTGQAMVGITPGALGTPVPILRAEKLPLTALTPGTQYFYQAFPGDAGKGSFKTAPAGAAPFQFVVYGDTRTRHDVHRAVIAAVLKYSNPDFVMQTGDLVENADSTALWPIFFDAERQLLRKAAYFPALGNHEHHSKNYYEFMDAKPYYSFNSGAAHFAVINR